MVDKWIAESNIPYDRRIEEKIHIWRHKDKNRGRMPNTLILNKDEFRVWFNEQSLLYPICYREIGDSGAVYKFMGIEITLSYDVPVGIIKVGMTE